MKQIISFAVALTLVSPLLGNPVFITPPSSSAGVVERPIEKEYEAESIPEKKEIPILEFDEPTEQLDLEEGETIEVSRVVFCDNTVFSSECLENLIQDRLSNRLTLKDAKNICATIKAYYVDHGYFLTRVYLPPQDVNEKVLQIVVLEGKLGCVSIEGNHHYSSHFIDRYFSHLKNRPLQYDSVMKALFLLNENTDMSAGAIFKRGKCCGTAVIVGRINPRYKEISRWDISY